MYPMLSVSLDCPFVISPSVFSYVYSLMIFRCYFVLLMRVARLCSVLCVFVASCASLSGLSPILDCFSIFYAVNFIVLTIISRKNSP